MLACIISLGVNFCVEYFRGSYFFAANVFARQEKPQKIETPKILCHRVKYFCLLKGWRFLERGNEFEVWPE